MMKKEYVKPEADLLLLETQPLMVLSPDPEGDPGWDGDFDPEEEW